MKTSAQITSSWQRVPRAARIVTSVVLVIAMVNLILALLDVSRNEGAVRGPRSSSFSTSPDGTAGLFDLLSQEGFETVRSRDFPSSRPAESGTMFVLDPGEMTAADARTLRAFAERGGRLVLGGEIGKGSLSAILDSPPTWASDGPRIITPTVPLGEVATIGSIEGEGSGWWSAAGEGAMMLAGEERPILLAVHQGSGRILLLADPSPLHNRWLATRDAAALAIALAGEPGSRVTFAEAFHGYGKEGLNAVPSQWLWMLGALSAAVLLFMWHSSKRLGPGNAASEPPLPARIAYVDALSLSLATAADRPVAIEKLQKSARSILGSRLGIPPDTEEKPFRRTAVNAGIDDRVNEALWRRPTNDDEVLAVGRELAAIHRGEM